MSTSQKGRSLAPGAYLPLIFGADVDRALIATATEGANGKPEGFIAKAPTKAMLDSLIRAPLSDAAHYVTPSTYFEGTTTRDAKAVDKVHMLVIDDVGNPSHPKTKVDIGRLNGPFTPQWSFLIETSPDIYQAVYVIKPAITPEEFKALGACIGRKFGNDAASDMVHLWRMPSGCSAKKESRGFQTTLVEATGATHTLEELVAGFDFLDNGEFEAAKQGKTVGPSGGFIDKACTDEEEMEGLVSLIPNAGNPDFDTRDAWMEAGHAIYGASAGSDRGLKAWIGWSSQRDQTEDLEKVWESLSGTHIGRLWLKERAYRYDPKGADAFYVGRAKSAFDVVSPDDETAAALAEKKANTPSFPVNTYVRSLWDDAIYPRIDADLMSSTAIAAAAHAASAEFLCEAGPFMAAAVTVAAGSISDTNTLAIRPRWKRAARLWTILVGPPGSSKTPVIDRASEPVHEQQTILKNRYDAAMGFYKAMTPAQQKLVPKPKPKIIVTSLATPEALAQALGDSEDGILLSNDEISGWLAGMGQYKNTKGAAMAESAFWLRSFEGGGHTSLTVTRGMTHVPHLSVTVLGGVQPGVIKDAIGATGQKDGFVHRIITVRMEKDPMVSTPPPDIDKAWARYAEVIKGCMTAGDASPHRNPVTGKLDFTFDPVAQKVFDTFHADMQKEIKRFNDQQAYDYANILAKMAAGFASYALTCHLIEEVAAGRGPDPAMQIPEKVAIMADRFFRDYVIPTAKIDYLNATNMPWDTTEILQKIAERILIRNMKTVTVRDIYRSSHKLRDAGSKVAEMYADRMVVQGWLHPLPSDRAGWKSWLVNPEVHTKFQNEKIRALQRKKDQMTS